MNKEDINNVAKALKIAKRTKKLEEFLKDPSKVSLEELMKDPSLKELIMKNPDRKSVV